MATSGRGARDTTKGATDFTLRIAPMTVELAPQVVISTIGYSNKVPGPLMRVREEQRVAVEVVNDTDVPEYVHWHGLLVPSDVDGAEEEGTPAVPAHGRRRYEFVAKPAGSRWYHSHTMAMTDLHRGAYTGQFGFLMIDSANDPGRYDQEVFLALREWNIFSARWIKTKWRRIPTTRCPKNPLSRTSAPMGSKSTLLFTQSTTKCLERASPSA
jgi:FtsP/CotA-like multicopper oxidase with cupredoxin domain